MIKSHEFQKIDDVSKSFCVAKWKQVTIDLMHGTNHSCHHPKRHEIPLRELEDNPSALHNTKFKKKQRKMMLKGKRPPECQYCWNIEDSSEESFSDRYHKSTEKKWAFEHIDSLAKSDWKEDINPSYLEVFFSDICNLSCSYCMADVSTSIRKEIEEFGPLNVKEKEHRLPSSKRVSESEEDNPYIQAFWKWLPDLIDDLRVLRVTGGEPLLSKNTFKLLEFVAKEKRENLEMAINSNFSVPDSLMDKFFEALDPVMDNVQSFMMFTSVDTHGKQAEYIRSGLEYERMIKNIKRFSARYPDATIVVMCCFNILSIPSFKNLLEDVLELKKLSNVYLDISYLRAPSYLSPVIANEQLKDVLKESLDFMELHKADNPRDGFMEFEEVSKLRRLYYYLKSLKEVRRDSKLDFFKFIQDFDNRKKTDFFETFPELIDFFEEARSLSKRNLFNQKRHFI